MSYTEQNDMMGGGGGNEIQQLPLMIINENKKYGNFKYLLKTYIYP